MAASEDGFVIDALAIALTIAFWLAALYVLVGIVLLPVWGIGSAFRVGTLRRVGGGWWRLPVLTLEAGGAFIERFTAERDGSRWKRPDPKPASYDEPAEPGNWARDLGIFALWALAIVGGFVLLVTGHDSIIRPLAGGPAAVWFAVAIVLVTAASAVVAWVLSRRYRSDRPPAFRFTMTVAILGGVMSWLVISDISAANQLVEDYCSYGSVSERQLATCKTHVSANHIRAIDTPASHFAFGDSTAECGAGSGPFCERVLNYRYLEEQQPPPGDR